MSKVYDRYTAGVLDKTGVTLNDDLVGSDDLCYHQEAGSDRYKAYGLDCRLIEAGTPTYDRYEKGVLNHSVVTLENHGDMTGSIRGSDGFLYTKIGTGVYYAYGADYLLMLAQSEEATVRQESVESDVPTLNVGDVVSIYGQAVEVLLVHDGYFAYIDEEEGLTVDSIGYIDKCSPETLEQFCERESERVYGVHISNLDAEDAIALASKYLESRLPKSDS